ncbi:phosphoribosyltransferase [Albimonas pacifica]|uniref:Putative phosphoribosyl transferase n=1 Tax=Albimonas pacifica TaxID=1114924 RepID=A0A1I3IZ44_9RHOB|nr:phosphoribosyltransferase family protein [Albimonas pacifica]SFI53086.1 putative phosphoribosyl transferase [Albimonas pacifica]
MIFADRAQAGARLLARLPRLDPERTVVLALPRGGVPVAAVIAEGLGAPLDVVLVRKIGLPGHAELAVGAVCDGPAPQLVVNEAIARSAGLDRAAVEALAHDPLVEIERRRLIYRAGRPALPLAGRSVVLVDDGVATGATMHAALKAVRAAAPARVILAVPVAAPDALEALAPEVDEAVCLTAPEDFRAVGMHYDDFTQVSDRVVTALLARFAPPRSRHLEVD